MFRLPHGFCPLWYARHTSLTSLTSPHHHQLTQKSPCLCTKCASRTPNIIHSTTAQLRNATPRNAAQHHKDTQRAESGSRSLPITSYSHRAVCTNEADKRTNEADERTNERTFGERTNERTNELWSERTLERTNERTNELWNERTNERTNFGRTNERNDDNGGRNDETAVVVVRRRPNEIYHYSEMHHMADRCIYVQYTATNRSLTTKCL